MLWHIPVAGQGERELVGNPVKLSRTPLGLHQPPTGLGGMSAEVLSRFMPIDYCLDPHQPVKATPPYYAYTRAISRIRSFVSGLVVWCR